MKKFFIRLIAAASAAAICITSVSAYSAQFDGEYFGEGFDAYDTDKMQIADGWSNGGMFDCTWSSANVGFSDGKLNLSIYGNGWSGYTGGECRTNQTFGYGMYDVSMKPAKNDGIISSFFTYTGPTDGTVWDEIDIEFLGKDTTKVQFNYYTNGVGNHEYLYDLGFDASEGFHHYGFYWGESSITWYVDEKPVYTATKDIPSTPGKIMMNIWNGTGVDSWLNRYNGVAPLTAQYDWISYTKPSAGPAEPSVPSEPSAPAKNADFPAQASGTGGYCSMTIQEFNKAMNGIDDRFLSAWEERQEKFVPLPEGKGNDKARPGHRRLWALILAACLVIAMALTAYAVNFMGIREAMTGTLEQASASMVWRFSG